MIYAVIGATASSKSSYSVQLAKKVNAEIINVDAYSIYNELDIVSAKITPEEMEGVTHHFVSYFDLDDENVNIATFQKLARKKIDDILSQGKNVVLVGGSNLYMQSILFCYEIDESLSYDYDKYDLYTDEEVVNRLLDVDSEYINIAQNNRRRMIKAILYFEMYNKKYSDKIDTSNILFYDKVKFIYLRWDRQTLYERINLRVDLMFEKGLVEEFNYLSSKYDHNIKAFKAIGFKEFLEYKEMDLNSLHDIIAQNTRRFAKRQITWINNKFLKNENIELEIIDMK